MAARKSDPLPALKAKHKRFADEYLIDLNGAAAAVRAGYAERSARYTARELLGRDDVQAHIAAGRTKAAEIAGVTREAVLKELARIAFFDLRELVTWAAFQDPETGEKGRLVVSYRDSKELTPAAVAAIAEITQGMDGFRVRTHSKMRALELLAKHLRLLEKDEVDNNEKPANLTPDNIGEVIERARLYAVAAGRKTPAA